MTQVRHVTIAPGDEHMRLDRWFHREYPAVTHGHLAKLLRTGQVRLDGRRCKPGDRLVAGQTVRVPPLPEERAAEPHAKPEARIDRRTADELASRVLYPRRRCHRLRQTVRAGGAGWLRHQTAFGRHARCAQVRCGRTSAAGPPARPRYQRRHVAGAPRRRRPASSATCSRAGRRRRPTGRWSRAGRMPMKGLIDMPLAQTAGQGWRAHACR